MTKRRLVTRLLVISIAILMIGAKKPDRNRLRQIKSVAVIDFRVPWQVSDMAGTTSMLGLIKAVRARNTQEALGTYLNGDEVASEAVVGFVEELAETGVFRVVDHRTVTEDPVIRGLVSELPPEEPGRGSATAAGLPNSPVGRLTRVSRAATEALEVDAVIVVTFWSMSYGGGSSTVSIQNLGPAGKGKAIGRATLRILDPGGRELWSFKDEVESKGGAWQFDTFISPSKFSKLNYGIGAGLAHRAMKEYRKQVLR